MADPDKLDQFAKELRTQHDQLTKEYETALAAGETAWAKVEAAKKPLTEFRAKYGRVLKALDGKTVKVTDRAKPDRMALDDQAAKKK